MDPVELCARGEAAWQATACAGLGAPWHVEDDVAWTPAAAHRFLLAAVTLRPGARAPGVEGVVGDSFGDLSLEGRTRSDGGGWMVREPGPLPPVAGDVRRTTDELLFERTAFLCAGGFPPGRPGELHPAGSSDLPGLHLLLAWRGEVPIGSALAVVHADGVVISAVSVDAAHSRQGLGAALAAAAVAVAPDCPATLCSSALGAGTYRSLGFVEVGRAVHWR